VEDGVGGNDPAHQAGDGVEESQSDGATPVLGDEGHLGQADSRRELGQPLDVGRHGVRRPVQRLVGTAEADQIRGHGAQAAGGQAGHHRAVEVGPRGLAVEEEDHFGIRRPFVDVMQAQPVRQLGMARQEGKSWKVTEALFGCPHDLHDAHSAAPLARRAAGLLDSGQ
jgi:hypothetical protein